MALHRHKAKVTTATTRRSFLKTSAATAGLFSIVPRHVLGGPGHTPFSEQLTKAVIGVGAMGRGHLGLGGTRLLAVRLGRPLHFDPARQVFLHDEAANRLIDQPMRTPWRI